MHILLNGAQATGIQENSYGWRLVLDKFMFTLTNGFRNLIGQVPTAVLRLALERIRMHKWCGRGWGRRGSWMEDKGEMRGVPGRGSSQLSTASLCSVERPAERTLTSWLRSLDTTSRKARSWTFLCRDSEDKNRTTGMLLLGVFLLLLYTLPKAYTQNAWLNDAVIKTDVLNFVANEKAFYLSRGSGKHAYLQPIHVAVQRKPTQHCKTPSSS